jgi:Protein of unknown function (DUF1588)/Protein of unknown function (DUF1592)
MKLNKFFTLVFPALLATCSSQHLVSPEKISRSGNKTVTAAKESNSSNSSGTSTLEVPQKQEDSKVEAQQETDLPALFKSRAVALSAYQLNEASIMLGQNTQVQKNELLNGDKTYSTEHSLATFDSLKTESLLERAEKLAPLAIKSLNQTVSCVKEKQVNDMCTDLILKMLSEKIFRRPVESIPDFQYSAFAKEVFKEHSFDEGWLLIAETMLISPYSVFRLELRNKAEEPASFSSGTTQISLAEAVSFSITDRAADNLMIQDAKNGVFISNLETHVSRLIETPLAKRKLANFLGEFFEIGGRYFEEKPTNLTGNDWPAKREFVLDSFMKSADEIVSQPRDILTKILTLKEFFVNSSSAALFGAKQLSTGESEWVKLKTDGVNAPLRMSLVAHPAFLGTFAEAQHNRLVQRGEWIARKLTCFKVPAPTTIVPSAAELVLNGGTLRERLMVHKTNPSCVSCHKFMDPFAEPFERFDALGRWRELDNSKPVDTSAEIPAFTGSSNILKVSNHEELMLSLANNTEVQKCFLSEYLSYISSKTIPLKYLNHSLKPVFTNYESNKRSLASALTTFFKSDFFSLENKK